MAWSILHTPLPKKLLSLLNYNISVYDSYMHMEEFKGPDLKYFRIFLCLQ